VIHLAGPAITIDEHRRQRCSWCGTIIEDVDLSRVSMPICDKPIFGRTCEREMGHPLDCGLRQPGDFTLAGWPFEALVDIDGTFPRITSLVEPEMHEDGTVKIPDGSCMSLPFDLTGRHDEREAHR
jgi:hypothetical protein